MALPAPLSMPLNATASVLETTAGLLRTIAGSAPSPQSVPAAPPAPAEPSAAAELDVHPPAGHGIKPSPGTRTQGQISKPKAARNVRHRGATS